MGGETVDIYLRSQDFEILSPGFLKIDIGPEQSRLHAGSRPTAGLKLMLADLVPEYQ